MNVQAKLKSLNRINSKQGFEPLPDDPNNPLEAVPEFPLSGDLNKLDSDTLTVIINRVNRFRKRYPEGEYRRPAGSTDRKYVHYKDIMARHPKVSAHSAKRILANIRFFMQKRTIAKISVKVYCQLMNENEEDLQMFLEELDGQLKQQNQPS